MTKNYYPQDFELITEKAKLGIQDGYSASFSITVENEEKLVIVAEVERAFRPRESSHQNEQDAKNDLIQIRQKVTGENGIQPYSICLIK